MSETTLEQARAAKQAAIEAFKGLGQVVGVGITRIGGGYGLKINLQEPPPTGVALPQEINGVPIQVDIVGRIRKR